MITTASHIILPTRAFQSDMRHFSTKRQSRRGKRDRREGEGYPDGLGREKLFGRGAS